MGGGGGKSYKGVIGERQSSRKKKLTAVAQAAVDSGSIDMPYMRVSASMSVRVDGLVWFGGCGIFVCASSVFLFLFCV